MKEEVFALHSELESVHWWFVSRRKILLPLIRRIMSDAPGDLIVDVGCGTGGTVESFHNDFNCIGIDPSESGIEKARAAYPSCQFICGRAPDDLGDVKERAALYLLMDVLEHIEDDQKFLADLVAHARPGSHFLITVPAHMALWSQHDETALHVRRYELEPFKLLWSGLPVQPLLVSFFNARLYPAIWVARKIGNLLGITFGSDGTDLGIPPAPVNSLLKTIFSGESMRINQLLDNPKARPYNNGVSLLCLLRRN
ncbi:MAG: class I SAM-dependent methyltransferase [Rhodospirillales bacterium]|nr:class I SAM-dependent methyltransferase [Rhodospirillales bacterium]